MTDAEILADPTFQLNVALWMLQPAPEEASSWPLLLHAGYVLDSVGRRISPPFGARAGLREVGVDESPPSPDVIASPPEKMPWLVIECKGSGFGPDSTTAHQAMKILAASHDLRAAIGLAPGQPAPGTVMYLTRSPEHEAVADTLGVLSTRLAEAGVADLAPSGALGLTRTAAGVDVAQHGYIPQAVSSIVGNRPVLALRPGEDPRPLYLVPWLPGQTQDPDLARFAQDVLFARVQSEAVSLVGRVQPPARVVLAMDRLLESATFGLWLKWRDRNEIRQVEQAARDFLTRGLRPLGERLRLSLPPGAPRIEIELRSRDDADAAVSAILHQDAAEEPRIVDVQSELPFEGDAIS